MGQFPPLPGFNMADLSNLPQLGAPAGLPGLPQPQYQQPVYQDPQFPAQAPPELHLQPAQNAGQLQQFQMPQQPLPQPQFPQMFPGADSMQGQYQQPALPMAPQINVPTQGEAKATSKNSKELIEEIKVSTDFNFLNVCVQDSQNRKTVIDAAQKRIQALQSGAGAVPQGQIPSPQQVAQLQQQSLFNVAQSPSGDGNVTVDILLRDVPLHLVSHIYQLLGK